MTDTLLMTLAEAGAALHVHARTVRRMLDRGDLAAARTDAPCPCGGRIVRRADQDTAWCESCGTVWTVDGDRLTGVVA